MDPNKKVTFALDNPRSAFTRFVRPIQVHPQDARSQRRSAFARIKQLFKLQPCDLDKT